MKGPLFTVVLILAASVNGDQVCNNLKAFLNGKKGGYIPAPLSRVKGHDELLSCVKNCTLLNSCRSFKYYSMDKKCTLLDSSEKLIKKQEKISKQRTAEKPGQYHQTSDGNCSQEGYKYDHRINTCIRIYKLTKIWTEARDICQSDNGSLVIIKSKKKHHILTKLMQYKKTESVWIGASDVNRTDTFVWCDGSKMIYKKWFFFGEPSHKFGEKEENCVEIRGWKMYKWNDSNCNKATNFICETKPNP